MIKYFCDRCGKEMNGGNLCDKCEKEVFTYGFKVGDIVIASDGRTGVIESFCTCTFCKDRKFYEPKVKTTFGEEQIYITDIDRDDGFLSFYKIGDQTFGNVDKDVSAYLRQHIVNLKHAIIECEAQLNMIKKLENNNEI